MVRNQSTTVHKGAFCRFPFRWINYYHSSKSTGKETGKMHLCAVVWVFWEFVTCFRTAIWDNWINWYLAGSYGKHLYGGSFKNNFTPLYPVAQQQFRRVFVSKLRSRLSLAPGCKIIHRFGIAHDWIILQQCEREHFCTVKIICITTI